VASLAMPFAFVKNATANYHLDHMTASISRRLRPAWRTTMCTVKQESARNLILIERLEVVLLRWFCRPLGTPDYPMKNVHYSHADALALARVFPDFESAIRGKDVLDFGSGYGYQTIALAEHGAASSTGVEIEPGLLASARALAEDRNSIVLFTSAIDGLYDVIYSQNSFEHFQDPEGTCADLRAHLRPGGRIFITFAPPWLSPYGAHMFFFTRLPWVHLLFPERIVMAARAQYRSDGAKTYSECGLAKMTIQRFEQIIQQTGVRVEFCRYDCVRSLNFLAHIPLLREMFINRVSCILTAG